MSRFELQGYGIELYDPDQLCCRYFHVPGQQGDKDDERSRIKSRPGILSYLEYQYGSANCT